MFLNTFELSIFNVNIFANKKLNDISKKIIYLLLGAILISFFGIKISVVLFMFISLVINAILVKYQLVKRMYTDFELSTFSITLITLVTNIKIGLIFALFPKFIAAVHTKSFSLDTFFVTTTY
jgi:hypothetical protein